MYWQNSRQYFDELAAHYKQADPKYYKEYIEPFYTNPFANVQGQKQGSSRGSAKPILIIVIFMVLAFGGLAAFGIIYFASKQPDSKETEKLIESTDKQEVKPKEIKPKEEKSHQEKTIEEDNSDPSELSSEDNFIIGSKYLGEKKYDKAEYHLRKVKPGEKYYKESQQLLESMKFLRQYDK